MVRVFVAHKGMAIVGQTGEPKAGGSDAKSGQGVQACMMPSVDLGQQLSLQVLGQWRESGVQDNVIQFFGQQFSVQVDVGAVPNLRRQSIQDT